MKASINELEKIERIYNTIYHTARINIERTKTNKESLKIEELYLPKVKRIFKQIVKEYEGKLHFLHEAEKRHGTEIKTIIKSMVTKTYLLGIEYVSRATSKPEYILMTPNDLTQIMLQSDEAYRMFWRLVTKYLQVLANRQQKIKTRIAEVIRSQPLENTDVTLTDEVVNASDSDDNLLFDIITNARLIISGIVTTTLALATLETYKQYIVEKRLIDGKNDDDDSIGTTTTKDDDAKVVFATEKDAAVCPICFQLEGLEWDVNDPSILIPKVHTHPRCRCRLLIKINGKTIAK